MVAIAIAVAINPPVLRWLIVIGEIVRARIIGEYLQAA
jgi:hypothetical protein